jgi:hypothetical protein
MVSSSTLSPIDLGMPTAAQHQLFMPTSQTVSVGKVLKRFVESWMESDFVRKIARKDHRPLTQL